ncbi:MAG: TIGR03118 family protein [Bacteroidetes bacterium]|nr:TIGR03118 family protein [Bacteroidota bacterium]
MKRHAFFLVLILGGAVACKKNNNNDYNYPPAGPGPIVIDGNFKQTNLVGDVAAVNPAFVDASMVNPWGLALNSSAHIIWIASNHGGVTDVYDSTGKTLLGPIPIPSMGNAKGGTPTGALFNTTTDFAVPGSAAATKFIFVNEDGTVSAWALGAQSATTVADQSASGAVYKGCAIAVDGGANFLYVANFKGGKVDVFDKNFQLTTGRDFKDASIPAGFAPFNVVNIGGLLYVAYAKQEGPENEDDQAGAGNGYVDIFTPDGKLMKNFTSKGPLNSPWGITKAPAGSGLAEGSILIGNFGDGWINVFDPSGTYKGALQSNGQPVVVPGLWAIDFLFNEDSKFDPAKLYFTAGPNEAHGIFGYLKKQ